MTMLLGLVLAGGKSSRMGEDKGSIDWAGQPLVRRCHDLLAPFCSEVLISVRPGQRAEPVYRGLSLVTDDPAVQGPAAGLLAAWARHGEAALLVLAVDLPLVDAGTIEFLVTQRDPACLATAFRHPNGILEPLCAIFEPGAAVALQQAVMSTSAPSLRRLLESGPVRLLEPPEPAQILSCNTPEALAAARDLARQSS